MVRRNSSSPNKSANQQQGMTQGRGVDFDIQQELARLQEIIYDSFHIPLTQWTIVDEGKLLDQLEMIGDRIPEAIRKALAVLEQEQEILAEAEGYAQRIIQSAQQEAAQILDESGIIQQAQREANQLRQQVQQDCEDVQSQTIAEVEQLRQVTTNEIQQLRQQSLAECQKLEDGANEYAERVLNRLEDELGEMLTVIRNGRQQLYDNASSRGVSSPGKQPPNSLKKRPQ
jgi:cell division septum initiation protein DivIVA